MFEKLQGNSFSVACIIKTVKSYDKEREPQTAKIGPVAFKNYET